MASTVMCLLGSLVVIIMWKSLVMFARYFQLPAFWACGRTAFSGPLVTGWVPVPSACQRVVSGSATCIAVQAHLIAAARPSKVLSTSPSEARNIWLIYQPGSQNEESLSGAPSQLAVDMQCEQIQNPSLDKLLKLWSCLLMQHNLAHSDG